MIYISEKRKTIRIDNETYEKMIDVLNLADVKSHNEFIINAIKYYIEYLNLDKCRNLTAELITNIVTGIVKDSEDKISKMIFKQAVEINKTSMLLAGLSEINEETYKMLHKNSVEQVRRTNGSIKFEDIYKNIKEN